LKTEGELAAVLSHQMAHVVARDTAKELATKQLTAGLVNAKDDAAASTEMHMLAVQLSEWKHNQAAELAADTQAVGYMSAAGYSPNAMLGLFRVLSTSYYAGAPVPYFTTHPNPASRLDNIKQAIKALYPDGVPENLSQ
jgi:predicted Zn-dependent protease